MRNLEFPELLLWLSEWLQNGKGRCASYTCKGLPARRLSAYTCSTNTIRLPSCQADAYNSLDTRVSIRPLRTCLQ
jgi:hypothetical protein